MVPHKYLILCILCLEQKIEPVTRKPLMVRLGMQNCMFYVMCPMSNRVNLYCAFVFILKDIPCYTLLYKSPSVSCYHHNNDLILLFILP